MANQTAKDAKSIKGTNPQYLVEKIIRTRIYDCKFWKEDCFGLTFCISSVGDLKCAVSACPSSPETYDMIVPRVTSSSSPQVTSSPSSPGTDSTTAPPTCSCSTEAIVITGAVAGVSGIVITLTLVGIVAVIRRRRASDKLKDLNMGIHNPVFANITATEMTDCPAYGKTTQHQQDGLNIRSDNVFAIGMTDCPAYGETTQQQQDGADYDYVSSLHHKRQSNPYQEGQCLKNSQGDSRDFTDSEQPTLQP